MRVISIKTMKILVPWKDSFIGTDAIVVTHKQHHTGDRGCLSLEIEDAYVIVHVHSKEGFVSCPLIDPR